MGEGARPSLNLSSLTSYSWVPSEGPDGVSDQTGLWPERVALHRKAQLSSTYFPWGDHPGRAGRHRWWIWPNVLSRPNEGNQPARRDRRAHAATAASGRGRPLLERKADPGPYARLELLGLHLQGPCTLTIRRVLNRKPNDMPLGSAGRLREAPAT